jgi:hypothetical protein
MPRLALAKAAPAVRADALEAMRELRVGLHIAQLRGLAPQLEPRGVPLAGLLDRLAAHFGGTPASRPNAAPSADSCAGPVAPLLAQIDDTLRAVCRAADGEARATAAAALASMRRDLFPRAESYQPLPEQSR